MRTLASKNSLWFKRWRRCLWVPGFVLIGQGCAQLNGTCMVALRSGASTTHDSRPSVPIAAFHAALESRQPSTGIQLARYFQPPTEPETTPLPAPRPVTRRARINAGISARVANRTGHCLQAGRRAKSAGGPGQGPGAASLRRKGGRLSLAAGHLRGHVLLSPRRAASRTQTELS